MKPNTQRWLKGMISAFITGGAAAVSSSGMTAVIDPDKFNPMKQTWHFISLMTCTFIASGSLHLFIWWQQHPLPDDTQQFTRADFPQQTDNNKPTQ